MNSFLHFTLNLSKRKPVQGYSVIQNKNSSSINLFRYEAYALTGWLSGTREPVLVHEKNWIVSLVVNGYFIY